MVIFPQILAKIWNNNFWGSMFLCSSVNPYSKSIFNISIIVWHPNPHRIGNPFFPMSCFQCLLYNTQGHLSITWMTIRICSQWGCYTMHSGLKWVVQSGLTFRCYNSTILNKINKKLLFHPLDSIRDIVLSFIFLKLSKIKRIFGYPLFLTN